MLFTGSMGALIGSVKDSSDAEKNVSMLERVSGKMGEGNVALIALVQEEDESILNRCLSKFKTETIRWDAAVIAEEVEEAQIRKRRNIGKIWSRNGQRYMQILRC